MCYIYTTYYDNIKNLPKAMIPISIAGKAPDNYNGLEFKKLAPKRDFFMEWKENKDNSYYVKCFNERILNNLDFHYIYEDLIDIAEDFVNSLPEDDVRKQQQKLGLPYFITLVCYEKPNEFCHRHIIRDWFNKNGILCNELYDNNDSYTAKVYEIQDHPELM